MNIAVENCREDREMTAAEARLLQAKARRGGILVTWTVTQGTADFGELFVCRPQFIVRSAVIHLRRHLIAHDLEILRQQLPPGLSCTRRQEGDDPVIVEVWI